MTTTTYYDLNIVEGTDIVNPLTVDNPNYEKIDEVMHDNAVAGVTLANEITNATVHAITRENSECAVIRFIATSEWKAGDTATVDGVAVTALLPSGETLPDGAYVINANVLCILTGTNLTVYAERKKVDNANNIAYNDTTVRLELDSINNDIKDMSSELAAIKEDISGIGLGIKAVAHEAVVTSNAEYQVSLGKLSDITNGEITPDNFCGATGYYGGYSFSIYLASNGNLYVIFPSAQTFSNLTMRFMIFGMK